VSEATEPRPPASAMEATVAERGQITLPKAVRDALGMVKGSKLRVELDGARIVLRKDVDDTLSRMRGRLKLPAGQTAEGLTRTLRGQDNAEPERPAAPQRKART
jgi:antitoxin PrlF